MAKLDLPKAYEAKGVEDNIYLAWEKAGLFNPDNLSEAQKPFVISMPPPNATGILHTGHATMLAIQDLMVRYHRMKGDKALWVPGTDHASIATQTKVEKIIAKEGTNRHELGREKFLDRVDKFVEESRNTIKTQVRKMGSSCDWSRERFTLDQGLSEAVQAAFIKMYEDGLIYRGDRVVNWCPRCHSTLADDEIEYVDQQAKFYTFKYSKDFPFSIATTRPETKIGDTAVAVHPSDDRYKEYIGQTFEVEFVGVPLKIKVIADHNVDPEFGTGALGVTPAHSHVDYQMAIENDLEIVKVIDEDGKIHDGFGQYSGKSVEEARDMIVAELKKQGLLEKEEDMENKLSVCYRCDAPIEPLPSKQWFVAVDKKFKLQAKQKLNWDKDEASLKELSLHVVKSGLIKIVPERFEKTYYHWMENLHDWCISRQIWYGHRIPVWYKQDDREDIVVGKDKPEGNYVQDEDTLDTWFSSALWTFSTLGWPEKTKDLELYHPTQVMETGYDILFFWVARMIIMTTYCLNEIPFETVYLHGLVRDEKGVKMSKSLDNALDPLDEIDKYGTDALRLSMLIGVTPGNDFKLFDQKIAAYRNFVNKLWNISRYVLTSVEEVKLMEKEPAGKTLADKWILSRLNTTIAEVNKQMDEYQFSAAGESLQQFTWNELADWYLEIAKVEGDKDEILLYILQVVLKLWHPFCPFVTEELWKNCKADKMLIVSSWPQAGEKDEIAEKDLEVVKEVITGIRSLRSENRIEPVKLVKVLVVNKKPEIIDNQVEIIQKLARCEKIEVKEVSDKPENSLETQIGETKIYLDRSGIIDTDKERSRLNKEIKEVTGYIQTITSKLEGEFSQNAPEKVIANEKDKLEAQKDKLQKLEEQLSNLK